MSQSFSPDPGDRRQMIDLLHTAVDRGVTLVDTARSTASSSTIDR